MFHRNGPTLQELVRQALSSTERAYDLLAPKFDYTPFRTPDSILQVAADEISKGGPVDSVLDLCCGTGAATRIFQPICRQRIVGVDFSQGMLGVARRAASAIPGAAWNLVRADVLQLPFGEEFDLAVCFGALGHIRDSDQERFVRETARILRSGGRLVTATSSQPPFFSLRHWRARAFNAAMHLRNWIVRPPFIMFYLRFLLPEAKWLLESAGFEVEIRAGIFGQQYSPLKLVIATKR